MSWRKRALRSCSSYLSMAMPVSPPKRFPFCVVWTPIPVLTWLLPFVGHVGICLSSGIILDFAGPYYVAMDTMSFGHPTKYWTLDPTLASFPEVDSSTSAGARSTSADWDKALQACTSLYQLKPYSFWSQNCHHFVICFLNQVHYKKAEWGIVKIATEMFLKGRFVGIKGLAKTWLPHVCLVIAGSYLGGTTFLICWLLSVIAAGITWAYFSLQAKPVQGTGVVGLV